MELISPNKILSILSDNETRKMKFCRGLPQLHSFETLLYDKQPSTEEEMKAQP